MPSVASLVASTPRGHLWHISMPSGQWFSDKVPLCPTLMGSSSSPSGRWWRPRPRWILWGTRGRFLWHLITPWMGVQNTCQPWLPWSISPSMSKEVEPSWNISHTPREGLSTSPGIRRYRPSKDPGRTQRGPPLSWLQDVGGAWPRGRRSLSPVPPETCGACHGRRFLPWSGCSEGSQSPSIGPCQLQSPGSSPSLLEVGGLYDMWIPRPASRPETRPIWWRKPSAHSWCHASCPAL